MRKLLLPTLLFSIILSTSCRKDPKPDRAFPDLPEYSERGNNSGGVYINGNAWLTRTPFVFQPEQTLEVYSYPSGDSIILILNGRYKTDSLLLDGPREIYFVLKGVTISKDEDLVKLDKRSFALDGTTNYCGFSSSNAEVKYGKGTGVLTIGNVRVLRDSNYGTITNPIHPYIIPGKFDIEFIHTVKYTLGEGRFDGIVDRGPESFLIAP
ncbi:hypothetical protein ACFSJU_00585 [Paradesertivirga mongoliensis]|uniref:Uncharacterized protein n=1 Tax=Paradesertivirga mongoliensis TaxID=2100740 RepID=A0ABW4ZHA1_9SPHI|nr:hypothetical protein [Pedobacter mongoliensis]